MASSYKIYLFPIGVIFFAVAAIFAEDKIVAKPIPVAAFAEDAWATQGMPGIANSLIEQLKRREIDLATTKLKQINGEHFITSVAREIAVPKSKGQEDAYTVYRVKVRRNETFWQPNFLVEDLEHTIIVVDVQPAMDRGEMKIMAWNIREPK